MNGCFEFLNHIYGIFGFDFHLKLSTRPENYLGEIEVWNKAEKVIQIKIEMMTH
jgi:threonyl-tRNA synthetase